MPMLRLASWRSMAWGGCRSEVLLAVRWNKAMVGAQVPAGFEQDFAGLRGL